MALPREAQQSKENQGFADIFGEITPIECKGVSRTLPKKIAPPEAGRSGGASNAKQGLVSHNDPTRTALFLQAHSAFTPPGLTPNQLEAHRRDQLARLRLGLPLRRSADEIDESFNRPLTRAEIIALEGLK
ncbi:hypothetical protein LMG27198_29450 [Methylocystis echinoides]|uniref:Uncharacterized protein n=1 Tax=Methylocystis echinoides TaxID=29468 RepID=A0A9W6LSU5_9HYPH|nr:hypothetical protein LMG27198_29450 [Methylocystis echinoides]